MADEVAKRYEPTAEERAALDAYIDRKKDAVACPRLKFTHNEDGMGEIAVDHVEPRLAWTVLTQALGSTDTNFASVVASQLASAVGRDLPLTEGLNFMLTVVKAIEPKNELESLLATQMAAVHVATMAMACRLASSTNTKQQDSAERSLNKLARTFAMQLETLKRYRTGGEQKVTPAPEEPFNLTMRLYAPKSEALTGKWNPPPVVKVEVPALTAQ